MSWQLLAIVTPFVLVIYLIVTDFIDLYPFNDVSQHTKDVRKWELLNYFLPLLSAFCSWKGVGIIALAVSSLFLIGNIFSWWVPYFFGCSKKQKELLEKHFGKTIKILPPIKDHPIPNLEHMPVALLIVIWQLAALQVLLNR
jgi:hypothetical protein